MDNSTKGLLIHNAIEVQRNGHAPYTSIKVGSAILTKDNNIFTGCNIETESIAVRICAERNAIFSSVAAGNIEIKGIAVVANSASDAVPCNYCRLVISELCEPSTPVIIANSMGKIHLETTVSKLTPDIEFNPNSISELIKERRHRLQKK